MKMKKFMQIMALLLVVFSVLSLTACKKYHIRVYLKPCDLCLFAPIYDFARIRQI